MKKTPLTIMRIMMGRWRYNPCDLSWRKHFCAPTLGLENSSFPSSALSSIITSANMMEKVSPVLDPQATTEYRTNLNIAEPFLGTLALLKVQKRSKLITVIHMNMEIVRK